MTRLPPTTSRDRLARLRARLHSEDGVTLMELMVAVSILAIVMVGFAAGLVNALDLAGGNRNRVIAANILDERMSELRSIDFSTVAKDRMGRTVETVERMGLDFELTEDIQMITTQAVDNACDSPEATPGSNQPTYLSVNLSVQWPRLADRGGKVASETIINPPISAYDAYDGHLSVKITDRDAQPVGGVMVYVQEEGGATPSPQRTTDDGCAFFVGLNPGLYEVWVKEPGWVDRETGLQDTSKENPQPKYSVQSASIAPVEFNYDEAATLNLNVSGRHGGDLPTPVGGSGPAVFPVTIANPSLLPLEEQLFPSVADLAADDLFPFAGGYDVWAGNCDDADPDVLTEDDAKLYPGAKRQVVAAEPDETTTAQLWIASVRIRAQERVPVDEDGDGRDDTVVSQPLAGARVFATSSCGNAYDLGATDSGGELLSALPYGNWNFRVEHPRDGREGEVDGLLVPTAAAAHVVEAEFPE